jgi:hypothetical protein
LTPSYSRAEEESIGCWDIWCLKKEYANKLSLIGFFPRGL